MWKEYALNIELKLNGFIPVNLKLSDYTVTHVSKAGVKTQTAF